MRMRQGVRTDLGHGGITCVLQTQFSSFVQICLFFFLPYSTGRWLDIDNYCSTGLKKKSFISLVVGQWRFEAILQKPYNLNTIRITHYALVQII